MAGAQTVRVWGTSFVVAVVILVVVLPLVVVRSERVLGEQTEDFDFDGLPGVQHEFKVHLPARAEDCYFQKAAKGATVYVSFQVLRGGDRNVNMIVRNSRGQVIQDHQWTHEGSTEFVSSYEDTYVVCVDNSESGFSEKLVHLYFVVFIMDDWTNFSKNMDDIYNFTENATKSVASVEQSVNDMKKSQSQFRAHAIRDYYRAHGNRQFVQTWSVLQCLVIVATSIGQVYVVRRLFRTVKVTPTSKPRA